MIGGTCFCEDYVCKEKGCDKVGVKSFKLKEDFT